MTDAHDGMRGRLLLTNIADLDELEEIAKLESLERTYGGASGGARRERTAAQAPEPEPAVPSRGGGIGRSGRPSGAAAVQSADYVREQYRQGKRAIEEEKRQLHERREREQLMQERENLEQYKSEAALKVRREATDVSRGESNSDATTHSSASSCSESGDEGEGRQRPTHLRRSLEEESGSESEDGSGSESEDEDDMLARAAASMDDTGGRDPLRSPQSDKTESEEYVGDGEDDLSDDFDDDDE